MNEKLTKKKYVFTDSFFCYCTTKKEPIAAISENSLVSQSPTFKEKYYHILNEAFDVLTFEKHTLLDFT